MKKAIIVTPYADPERGACSIRANFFAESLKSIGYITEVYSIKRESIQETKEVKRLASGFEFFKKIIEQKPKLVVAVSPPIVPVFFSLLASKITGAKFVIDAKDDPKYYEKEFSSLQKKIKQQIFLLVRRFTYTFSDALLFLTDSDYAEVKIDYSISEKKMFLVMNGTNTKLIKPSTKLRAEFRKENGLQDELLINYSGSLGDEEVVEFLNAIASFVKKNKAMILLVIAHDKSRFGKKEFEELTSKISSLNIQNKVILKKNVDYSEMPRYYSASDIGIIPWNSSMKNSIPVKLFDYTSAGLMVVAKGTKDSELHQFFKKYSLGEFYFDWDSFRKEIEKSFTQIKKIQQIGLANRIVAENFFDRKLQEKKFKQVIEFLEK